MPTLFFRAQNEDCIIPEDIKIIEHDVLRHKILITHKTEADFIDSDDIVLKIFNGINVL
jgi:MoxR-like ATPase